MCIRDRCEDTLFTTGISKFPITAINIHTKEILYAPKFDLPEHKKSASTPGICYSFPNAYLVFHSLDYEKEIKETQRLLSIDVNTGKIVFDTPLSISENRKDYTGHGLTYAKGYVWHLRENLLTKMDSKNGKILKTYYIENAKKCTSLFYYKESLWVTNFNGGVYQILSLIHI